MPDLATAVAEHRGRSDELLRIMRQRGTDLAEERQVTVFFTVPDEETANALSAQLLHKGFSEIRTAATSGLMERSGVEYSQGESPSSWSVQAVTSSSLERVASDSVSTALCQLAHDHTGTYDGWGT